MDLISNMSSRRYDQRLFACVQKGKCVKGLILPKLEPPVVEKENDNKTKRSWQTIMEERRLDVSDDKIVKMFLKQCGGESPSNENDESKKVVQVPALDQLHNIWSEQYEKVFTEITGATRTSTLPVDGITSMINNQAKQRQANKLGEELREIRDRMEQVGYYNSALN